VSRFCEFCDRIRVSGSAAIPCLSKEAAINCRHSRDYFSQAEARARIVELEAFVKCPIGLDNSPDICSAGTCWHCLSELRKHIVELERERDKAREERDDYKARFESACRISADLRARAKSAEAIVRVLAKARQSWGEEGTLERLRGCLGIWHFDDAAAHFSRHPDSDPARKTGEE